MKKITRKRVKKEYSLLPKNNFVVGLGSVLNIAGSYFDYNYSDTVTEADFKALNSDWNSVGRDFKSARDVFFKDNIDKLCLK